MSLLGEPFLSRMAPVDRQDPNFATPFFSDSPLDQTQNTSRIVQKMPPGDWGL